MTARPPIIAIDGPAGAGKTSVARDVASTLGFAYVDSGAMYRVVGHLAREQGIAMDDEAALGDLARSLELRFEPGPDGQRICVGDRVLGDEIRTPEAGQDASDVSKLGAVRAALGELQRRMGLAGGVVMEGRDIGTVIFPDAELKVFLTAGDRVRAVRRAEQMVARGDAADVESILAGMRVRDAQDSQRELAPLRPADDARLLDSSGLSQSEVVERVVAWARELMEFAP